MLRHCSTRVVRGDCCSRLLNAQLQQQHPQLHGQYSCWRRRNRLSLLVSLPSPFHIHSAMFASKTSVQGPPGGATSSPLTSLLSTPYQQRAAQQEQSSSSLSSQQRGRAPSTRSPTPDLTIPPGGSFSRRIHPMIVSRVNNMTKDDIFEQELIDTAEKLVMTKQELMELLQEEANQRLKERFAARARRAKRQSQTVVAEVQQTLSPETLREPPIPAEERIDALADTDDNEQIHYDDPVSMARYHQILLKEIRSSVQDKLAQLEDNFQKQETTSWLRAQTAKREQRARLIAEYKLTQSGKNTAASATTTATTSATATTADDTTSTTSSNEPGEFHYMRRGQQQEAASLEILNAVKLRENLIPHYQKEYGEREGDDYALPDEEKLYPPVSLTPTRAVEPGSQIQAKLRPRRVDRSGRSYGSGGRKRSRAQVWIQPGNGTFYVNHMIHSLYFERFTHRNCYLRPFLLTDTVGQYDVFAFVNGGGKTGQSGAIQLGIAKALVNAQPLLREKLKAAGMLTRDARKVERKKPGQPKARKKHAWVAR